MAIAVAIGILLAAGTLALVLYGAVSSFEVRCEACVTFLGRQSCRTASGPTEEEAKRTAVENACAFVASGMTQTVECIGRSPVTWSCE